MPHTHTSFWWQFFRWTRTNRYSHLIFSLHWFLSWASSCDRPKFLSFDTIPQGLLQASLLWPVPLISVITHRLTNSASSLHSTYPKHLNNLLLLNSTLTVSNLNNSLWPLYFASFLSTPSQPKCIHNSFTFSVTANRLLTQNCRRRNKV